MLVALPLPLIAIAVLSILSLMLFGVRHRNTACLVGAGCVLAVTVGFTISVSLLA